MSAAVQSEQSAEIDDMVTGLRRDGYHVVREAINLAIIAGLAVDLNKDFAATPHCEGGFYGTRTKRFGGLLSRSPLSDNLVRHGPILAAAQNVLEPFCDRIALNLTQAVAIHPGALPQFPHRDQDMWQGVKGEMEYLLNVMWPLTPFTAENGATRIWPGSHRQQDIGDLPDNEAIAPELMPGDALLFLGSTLHGGGGNITDSERRGIIVSYCLGWLKPFELQWLVYPPHVARHFDPGLAALIGYAQHRPNLGNIEGQCPSTLLKDDLPEHRGAIDALRPDQADALADFVADQSGNAES